MNAKPEFSFLVNCNKLQDAGKTFEIEANTQECQALAKRFDLLSIHRLKLKAFVSRQSAEVVKLQCNFSAVFMQKCVVSLKPLKKNIDCKFERIYSLKQESLGLSATLERGLIAVSIVEYDIEQLRSIAKFSKLTENHYLFEGFSEQRQMLLEKQIVHLASVCL